MKLWFVIRTGKLCGSKKEKSTVDGLALMVFRIFYSVTSWQKKCWVLRCLFEEHLRTVKITKVIWKHKDMEVMQHKCSNIQEALNKGFADWDIIFNLYHHDIYKNLYILWSIAVISQVSVNSGESLLDFVYRETLHNDKWYYKNAINFWYKYAVTFKKYSI